MKATIGSINWWAKNKARRSATAAKTHLRAMYTYRAQLGQLAVFMSAEGMQCRVGHCNSWQAAFEGSREHGQREGSRRGDVDKAKRRVFVNNNAWRSRRKWRGEAGGFVCRFRRRRRRRKIGVSARDDTPGALASQKGRRVPGHAKRRQRRFTRSGCRLWARQTRVGDAPVEGL